MNRELDNFNDLFGANKRLLSVYKLYDIFYHKFPTVCYGNRANQ